jgi:hypothetical protein
VKNVKVFYRLGSVPLEVNDVKFAPGLYREVWSFNTEEDIEPDDVFAMFNIEEENPLVKRQDIVAAKGLRHTSMSIGDVVDINGRKYIALSLGWRQL